MEGEEEGQRGEVGEGWAGPACEPVPLRPAALAELEQ